jgi:hypothetical protein
MIKPTSNNQRKIYNPNSINSQYNAILQSTYIVFLKDFLGEMGAKAIGLPAVSGEPSKLFAGKRKIRKHFKDCF